MSCKLGGKMKLKINPNIVHVTSLKNIEGLNAPMSCSKASEIGTLAF